MKNHRNVCFAKDAGFAKFEGLSGNIKTGCPNIPELKFKFCSKHSPTLVTRHCSDSQYEYQQGILIAKKTTQQSTLYEV